MKKFLVLLLPVMVFIGCKSYEPLPTVQDVDLIKYQGRWYEITKIPNKFEKNLTKVQANYKVLPSGRIEVINTGVNVNTGKLKRSVGEAKVNGPGRLGVTFFKPFYGDYYIIALDREYEWALVGSPSREFLWILAREPNISKELIIRLSDIATENGFDVSRLEKMEQ